jgi:hypothetical protein
MSDTELAPVSQQKSQQPNQQKLNIPLRLRAQPGGGPNHRMTTLTLFSPIAKQRVNNKQPSKHGLELDVERCAAMHNTLLLFGWVCSGKRIPHMEKKSWWSRHGTPELKDLLRPSLVKYLGKIFDVPGHRFFYHISGLASPKAMLDLGEVLKDDDHQPAKAEKHRYVVLYSSSEEHVSHPAGIV